MGKTAIATAALYDNRVVGLFGRRRVFAALDNDTEPRAILARIVEAMRLPAAGDNATLLRLLETHTGPEHLVAVLDNAEGVFDNDRAEAERLVRLASQVRGLSIVVTIRGAPPVVPQAEVIGDLPKLDPTASRHTFLSIAGEDLADDVSLPHLLDALDGHALSLHLVAAQATGLANLIGLREAWEEAHAEILASPGANEDRLTSVRASLRLSLGAKAMLQAPLARRLLALLARLPGGLAEDRVHLVLDRPGSRATVVACLRQLRLVEPRTDGRLRMLTPLRECVRLDVPINSADYRRLQKHYFAIAAKGALIGLDQWPTVREEVEAESENLDAICVEGVPNMLKEPFFRKALYGLSEFHAFSGKASVRSLYRAADALRKEPFSTTFVDITRWLGALKLQRSDLQGASALLNESLTVSRALDVREGQARALEYLSTLTQLRRDYSLSEKQILQAAEIYRKLGKEIDEADCIGKLGTIEAAMSNQAAAKEHFNTAHATFRKYNHSLGIGQSIQSLAAIEMQQSHLSEATRLYSDAREICKRIGAVANCVRGLADICILSNDFVNARDLIGEALPARRLGGDIVGEGDLIMRLGVVALFEGDRNVSNLHFTEALSLFDRMDKMSGTLGSAITKLWRGRTRRGLLEWAGSAIEEVKLGFDELFSVSDKRDRTLPGWRAICQAMVTSSAVEASALVEAARENWSECGRLDLVNLWLDRSDWNLSLGTDAPAKP